MEQRVGLETTLPGGPPELGNLTKLATSQIGFMNMFACPLFEAVADILPPMKFAVEHIKQNQTIWQEKIEEEKNKEETRVEVERYSREGFQSPRSGSPDRFFTTPPQQSHPEGLPATGSRTEMPDSSPLSTFQGTLDSLGKAPGDSVVGSRSLSSSNIPSSVPSQNSVLTQQGLMSAPSNITNVRSSRSKKR